LTTGGVVVLLPALVVPVEVVVDVDVPLEPDEVGVDVPVVELLLLPRISIPVSRICL
jgi:hypothetical protein